MEMFQYRVTYNRPNYTKPFEFFCMAFNAFLAEAQCVEYDLKESRDEVSEVTNVKAELVVHEDSPY